MITEGTDVRLIARNPYLWQCKMVVPGSCPATILHTEWTPWVSTTG